MATSVTSKKVPVHKNKRTASNNDKDCDNGNDSNASEAFEKRNKNTRHIVSCNGIDRYKRRSKQ